MTFKPFLLPHLPGLTNLSTWNHSEVFDDDLTARQKELPTQAELAVSLVKLHKHHLQNCCYLPGSYPLFGQAIFHMLCLPSEPWLGRGKQGWFIILAAVQENA